MLSIVGCLLPFFHAKNALSAMFASRHSFSQVVLKCCIKNASRSEKGGQT